MAYVIPFKKDVGRGAARPGRTPTTAPNYQRRPRAPFRPLRMAPQRIGPRERYKDVPRIVARPEVNPALTAAAALAVDLLSPRLAPGGLARIVNLSNNLAEGVEAAISPLGYSTYGDIYNDCGHGGVVPPGYQLLGGKRGIRSCLIHAETPSNLVPDGFPLFGTQMVSKARLDAGAFAYIQFMEVGLLYQTMPIHNTYLIPSYPALDMVANVFPDALPVNAASIEPWTMPYRYRGLNIGAKTAGNAHPASASTATSKVPSVSLSQLPFHAPVRSTGDHGKVPPRPPRGRRPEKERKIKTPLWGPLSRAISGATEGMDLINAVHDALPSRFKSPGFSNPLDKAADIWDAIDKMGPNEFRDFTKDAIMNMINESAEDYWYGKGGRLNAKASKEAAKYTGSRLPKGHSTGPVH